jgi:hypothetical protein
VRLRTRARTIRPPPNRNVLAYLVETSSAYHSLKDTEKRRELLGGPLRRLLVCATFTPSMSTSSVCVCAISISGGYAAFVGSPRLITRKSRASICK